LLLLASCYDPERQLNQKQPVKLWPDNKHSSDNNILLPTDEHADKIETKTQHGKFPQKIHWPNNQLGNMETQKGQQIQIQKNSPIITSLHYAHKTLRISLQKAENRKKEKKTTLLLIKSQKEEQNFLQTIQKNLVNLSLFFLHHSKLATLC
jgi:hypothetical protein